MRERRTSVVVKLSVRMCHDDKIKSDHFNQRKICSTQANVCEANGKYESFEIQITFDT